MKSPIILPPSTKINQENARKRARRERSLLDGAKIFSDILVGLTKSVPARKVQKTFKY